MRMIFSAAAVAAALAVGACADLGTIDTNYNAGLYDADRDGALTREEYGAIGDDFGVIDSDRSGFVDQREYTAWAGDTYGDDYGPQQTAELFQDWDDNGDSFLTDDEWADDEEFLEYDLNQDGLLDADEGLI